MIAPTISRLPGAHLVEIEEQALVEQIVAHPAVETPDKPFSMGVPGAMKCQSITTSLHQVAWRCT